MTLRINQIKNLIDKIIKSIIVFKEKWKLRNADYTSLRGAQDPCSDGYFNGFIGNEIFLVLTIFCYWNWQIDN